MNHEEKNLQISIVIPSYNQAQYISATLDSILGQDYPLIEIIVIDGGSMDGTVSILDRYKDHLAYIVSEKDEGQAHAIEKGLAVATGDVLCWLNSDDIYLPGALKAVNKKFLATDADVVYGNKFIINEAGETISCRLLTPFLPDFARDAYLCGGFGIYQPASFWKRSAYDRTGGVDRSYRFCMDNDLFNRFVISGAKFAFIDQYLAGFRVHGSSKTSTLQNIAEAERQAIYHKYVVQRGISFPGAKKLFARCFRAGYFLLNGKMGNIIKSRYLDNLKWVP